MLKPLLKYYINKVYNGSTYNGVNYYWTAYCNKFVGNKKQYFGKYLRNHDNDHESNLKDTHRRPKWFSRVEKPHLTAMYSPILQWKLLMANLIRT